jgi:hypothetical protein
MLASTGDVIYDGYSPFSLPILICINQPDDAGRDANVPVTFVQRQAVWTVQIRPEYLVFISAAIKIAVGQLEDFS